MKKERTFKNPAVLHIMLELRLQGWPLKELSWIFDCEKTSIRKACLRSGLPARLPLMERPIIRFQRVLIDFDGERINRGKNYKDYIRDAQMRKRNLIRL